VNIQAKIVTVQGAITADGGTESYPWTEAPAGGRVEIRADAITVSAGGSVTASGVAANAKGGAVALVAKGAVVVTGSSTVAADGATRRIALGEPNAGTVTVRADALTVDLASRLGADGRGPNGKGGTVEVVGVTSTTVGADSRLSAVGGPEKRPFGAVDGGTVTVYTGAMTVAATGAILASSGPRSDGGAVSVYATGDLTLSGKVAASGGQGVLTQKGGTVTLGVGGNLTTATTTVIDGYGQEKGGALIVHVAGDATLAGTTTLKGGTGVLQKVGGTVEVAAGGDVLVNGTVDVSAQENWTWQSGVRTPTGAVVEVRGTNVTVTGTVRANGGSGVGIQMGGRVTVVAAENLTLQGPITAVAHDLAGSINLQYCTIDDLGAILNPSGTRSEVCFPGCNPPGCDEPGGRDRCLDPGPDSEWLLFFPPALCVAGGCMSPVPVVRHCPVACSDDGVHGFCLECVEDSDCPEPENACMKSSCTSQGVCVETVDCPAHSECSATSGTLREYGEGVCVDQACQYPLLQVTDCLFGCDAGACDPGPSDPGTVASAPDHGRMGDLAGEVAFLYSGPDPIQTGMTADIDPHRVAVIRGKVLDPTGAPLPNVTIKIHAASQYGQTVTRCPESDPGGPDCGMFDLVVNGGGVVTVDYRKEGYLPAHRTVKVPWLDYVWAPDVVLRPLAPAVSIDLTSFPGGIVSGPTVTDEDGTRQPFLFFPQGTRAHLPGGSYHDQLELRMTEYSVGRSRQRNMPAILPVASAYTYAIEVSDDWALTYDQTLEFTDPITLFVSIDDFGACTDPAHRDEYALCQVGQRVPLGFYDRSAAAWKAEANGCVVELVSQGLLRELAGCPSVPTNRGAEEAAALALEAPLGPGFQPGARFWRVELKHLSAYDCNWPFSLDGDARPPELYPPPQDEPFGPACEQEGNSVIGCQTRTLGETLGVAGSPFTLNYRSNRVPGRRAAFTLNVPVTHRSNNPVVPSYQGVELEVFVAGRRLTYSFPGNYGEGCNIQDLGPDQNCLVPWDGLDAYGRRVQGRQPAHVRVGWVYPASYQDGAEIDDAFGAYTDGEGGTVEAMPARDAVIWWQEWDAQLGLWDARAAGLGGWTLSAHHAYDPVGRTLHLGTGESRTVGRLGIPAVIDRLAGGTDQNVPEGWPAAWTALTEPSGLATGPDGSVYVSDHESDSYPRVRRIWQDPNTGVHRISTVAGCDSDGGMCPGDTGTRLHLGYPWGLAVGPDESIYIFDADSDPDADDYVPRIYRIHPSGLVEPFAGNGTACDLDSDPTCGDGELRTDASFTGGRSAPLAKLAVSPDGNIYVADPGAGRVRRIDPGGKIWPFAGDPAASVLGDGGLATQAMLSTPQDVAVGPDGSVYICDHGNARIRKVGLEGVITTVAGTDIPLAAGEDGDRATWVELDCQSLTVGPDGSVYFTQMWGSDGRRLRKITPDGMITTVVGQKDVTDACANNLVGDGCGDRGPALQGRTTQRMYGLAIGPEGNLYFSQTDAAWSVRVVRPALPSYSLTDIRVPSGDGREVYVFDQFGQHQSTRDALSDAMRSTFEYDPVTHTLAALADADGNRTVVGHGQGAVTLTSPWGMVTTLGLPDADGYLESVTNGVPETFRLYHDVNGLLLAVDDPNPNDPPVVGQGNAPFQYTFDASGLLTGASRPRRGSRAVAPTDHGVTVTQSGDDIVDRVTTYTSTTDAAGVVTQWSEFPDGRRTTGVTNADGTSTVTYLDGSTVTTQLGPDPVHGMTRPIVKDFWLRTGGIDEKELHAFVEGEANGSGGAVSSLSLTTRVNQTWDSGSDAWVGGVEHQTTFDGISNQWTYHSPEGYSRVTEVDDVGRVLSTTSPGQTPVEYTYYPTGHTLQGKLWSVTQGARTYQFTYGPGGHLLTVTDPMLGVVTYTQRDAAGRPTQVVLPGNRALDLGYDLNGNLKAVTPPGRTVHCFGYDSENENTTYLPPDPDAPVAGTCGPAGPSYEYNQAGELTAIHRPDGTSVALAYADGIGRLEQVTLPGNESIVIGYHGPGANQGKLLSVARREGPDPVDTLRTGWNGMLLTSLTASRDSVDTTIGLDYDDFLRLWKRTVTVGTTAGETVEHLYDDDGVLRSVGSATGTMSLLRHQSTGLPSWAILGALSTYFEHNTYGERIREWTRYQGTTQVYDEQVNQRDALGRITVRMETVPGIHYSQTRAYEYDAAGRLSKVFSDAGHQSLLHEYTYDDNGNRLSHVNHQTNVTTTADPADGQDRITKYGGNYYRYTANGELWKKCDNELCNGDVWTYTYDAQGALRQVEAPASLDFTVKYLVDALGRRVGRELYEGGSATPVERESRYFVYQDALRPVAELIQENGQRRLYRQYVYATKRNVPDFFYQFDEGGTVTYRILSDHLGSPRVVVGTDGVVVERMAHDEWGNVSPHWAVDPDTTGYRPIPFGFAGGLYDQATGLVRFGVRDYDPEVGRWTNREQLLNEGASANTYSYARGDPVNRFDRTGRISDRIKRILMGPEDAPSLDPLTAFARYLTRWGDHPDEFEGPFRLFAMAYTCATDFKKGSGACGPAWVRWNNWLDESGGKPPKRMLDGQGSASGWLRAASNWWNNLTYDVPSIPTYHPDDLAIEWQEHIEEMCLDE
jgi:RHS repeat-associated protein